MINQFLLTLAKGIFMKKILCFTALLFVFSTAYGGAWGIAKQKGDSIFGTNSGNQTNINIGKDANGSEAATDSQLVNESRWNIDLEGLGMIMPHQPAPRGFVTGPISVGTTYKFSEAMHIVYKYVKYDIAGVELEGSKTKWKHEHHLIGFGMRRFFNNNEYQWVASAGSGLSSVKEESGAIEGDFDAPVWADISFLRVIDNFSFGLRFSFVEVDSKASKFEEYLKGGYTFVGMFVQFGLPGV